MNTPISNTDLDGADRDRAAQSRVRVLLVDDDPLVRETMVRWLSDRCGASVASYSSAEEAMSSHRPDGFDVCILDYRLDGADGVTLGAMLRQLNPDARLILLSGQLSANTRALAAEHGFGTIFEKPVSLDKLLRAVVA